MDYFADAMDIVSHWEGGWSNHAADPGGLTRWGWTLKTLVAKRIDVNLDGKIDGRDLSDLTEDHARRLYRRHFWDAVRGDELPGPLAMVVFNSAVNQGPGRATRFLQQAVGATVDGAIGPATLAAACRAYARDPMGVLREFLTWQVLHYTSLAIFATFGRGWMRRTFDVALAAAVEADDLAAYAQGAATAEPIVGHAPTPVTSVSPSHTWRRIVSALSGAQQK